MNGSADIANDAGSGGPSTVSQQSSASANAHPSQGRSIVLVIILNASEESKSMRKVALAHPYTYVSLQDTVAKSLQLSSMKTLYFTYKDPASSDNAEWRIDDEDVLELFLSEYAPPASAVYPRLTAVVVDKMELPRFHGGANSGDPSAATPSTIQLDHTSASSSSPVTAAAAGASSSYVKLNFRTVPCAHYNSGFCKKGDACTFLHCCKHCGGDHPRMNYCNEPKKHLRRRKQQQPEQDTREWKEDDAHSEAGSTNSERGAGSVERRAPHRSDKVCHGWNSKGGCKLGDECNFLHECSACQKASHGSTTCPEKKQYYCKRCNVSMKGQSRYNAHVATEEHQEKENLERMPRSM